MRSLGLGLVKGLSMLADPVLGGRRPGPRILIYHQVGSQSGLEMNVSVEQFEKQVDWMQVNGSIQTLDDALSETSTGRDDVFALTFDDGHAGVYEVVFPLLRQRRIPFLLYISTGPIDEGSHLHGDPSMPLLDWDQIGEMYETGLLTIGSHTHSHLDMTKAPVAVIAEELERSDAILREKFGVAPKHFAYPWGKWSATADGPVRTRYETATVGSGPAITPTSDRHRLSRIPVMASDRGVLFHRKMWGSFRVEAAARSIRDRVFD